MELAERGIEITRETLSNGFISGKKFEQQPEFSTLRTWDRSYPTRALLSPAPSVRLANFLVSAMIVRGQLLVRAQPPDMMRNDDEDAMEDDPRFRHRFFLEPGCSDVSRYFAMS